MEKSSRRTTKLIMAALVWRSPHAEPGTSPQPRTDHRWMFQNIP
jgi:hypothetical protein